MSQKDIETNHANNTNDIFVAEDIRKYRWG